MKLSYAPSLKLWFPWLTLLLVLLTIWWDQTTARTVENLDGPDVATLAGSKAHESDVDPSGLAIDPVCHMNIRKDTAHRVVYRGSNWYFCTQDCRDEFKADPEHWMTNTAPSGMHKMRGVPTWMYQFGIAVVILLSFGTFELIHWLGGRAQLAAPPRKQLFASGPARRLLKWPGTQLIARLVVTGLFVFIVAAGLFGNQNAAMNIAPLLTWTIWWVGLVFLILYFGKAWCYVCPWDAIATWVEGMKFWGPRKDGLGLRLRWPARMRNIWFAVGMFVLLTWIELGMGITLIPRATAWIALAMVAMAVAAALVFERKAFCRYACLVGRVSGLYSMFSGLELRTQDPAACASCKTMDCYRGNERGEGCPTFEFPRTLSQNTYCILCTECVKTCPKDNIAVRLRPWGEDLVAEGKPRADEAFLALILLSMTAFHGLTMTPVWSGWNESIANATGFPSMLIFTLLMAAILAAPIAAYWGLTRLSRVWSGGHATRTLFIHYAYAMLPIALFYHLAHNAEHFLMEGPKVFALASDPFGWGWNLFGTAGQAMAPLVTLEGLWVIQVGFVLIGHIYSLWISEKTTRRLVDDRKQAFKMQLPMLAAMVLFSLFSLWLLKQPMEMRVSAM